MIILKIGDKIDIPYRYKFWDQYSAYNYPITVREISKCNNEGLDEECSECPGLINNICFGIYDEFAAFKVMGEWNNKEN